MEKYELLPQQLLYEGTCSEENFFAPEKAADHAVFRAHDPEYVARLKTGKIPPREMRKVGFPWSEALVEREFRIAQGTIQGCEFARENGIAMNIAGGTHHAYSNRGEAFCMLNDQAIGAYHLLHKGLAGRILMLDLDVHQGNGTAEIFANVPEVFTFPCMGKPIIPSGKKFQIGISPWRKVPGMMST